MIRILNIFVAVESAGRRKYVAAVFFLLHKITNYLRLIRSFGHSAYLNSKKETHYEVLNLNNNCSKQDIRNAFLRLSKQVHHVIPHQLAINNSNLLQPKQYHPDVTNGAVKVDRTARFLKITEAYQTLVKPTTRREYDDSLLWNPPPGTRETIQPWEVKPTYNPNPGPYYGIQGLNRVSNTKIALFLMALGILGAIFGFSSVK